MKLKLKSGEHIRIQTDGASVTLMVYIDHGLIHVTAQPPHQPTRVIVDDVHVKIEAKHREA